MNKNVLSLVLAGCLVIALGRVYWLEQGSDTRPTYPAEQERGLADAKSTDPSASRLSSIESNLAQITEQVAGLHELVKNNLKVGDVTDTSEQTLASEYASFAIEPELDPFSPEGIAKADEQQNNYILQIDRIYQAEESSEGWARTVESNVLAKLSDLSAFEQRFNSYSRSAVASPNSGLDISVSNFNCRSQLCATEVISGTLDEMLAYQNYMVEQTKAELPSIVFSTIEQYGNKFRMRAFLGSDEFEFPKPDGLQ